MRVAVILCVVFYSLVIVISGTTSGQVKQEKQFDRDKAIASIRNALKEREKKGFCGVLLIRHQKKDIFHEAFGHRDREAKQELSVKHGFDIGSLVKPITAIAIYRLEQDGKLKASDTLDKFFEEVPKDKKSITIQHLLEHKAGLPDIFGGDYQVVDKKWFLNKVLNCKLIAKIGERENYSNAGYSLLACIIEKVTGGSYEEYARDKVLKPAGTPAIGYLLPKWKNENLAVGYRGEKRWGTPLDKKWAKDGPSWNLRGNGGMLATTADMCKWYEALIDEKIVNKKQLEKFYAFDAGRSQSTGSRAMAHAGGNGIFNTLQISFIDLDFHMTIFSSVSNQQAERVWSDFQKEVIGLAKAAKKAQSKTEKK